VLISSWASAALLGDAVNPKTLDFSKFIDVVDHGAVVVNGASSKKLTRGAGATRAPGSSAQSALAGSVLNTRKNHFKQ
jgi:hypothetical protein